MTAESVVDLNNPDYYLNRELSILDFHLRVLEQAVDPIHPFRALEFFTDF
jgi:polyphosphate kinase